MRYFVLSLILLPILVFGQYQTFEFYDCYTSSEDGGVSEARTGLENKIKQQAIAQAGQTIRSHSKLTTTATNNTHSQNYFDETTIESQGRIKTTQKAGSEKKELVGDVIKYCAAYTVSVDTGVIFAYYRKLGADSSTSATHTTQEIPREGFVLRGVNFQSERAFLMPSSYDVLDDIIKSLKDWTNIKLEIRGHTDAMGKREMNIRLSKDRANVVMKYFIDQGISYDRLRAVGYGGDIPIADNNTLSGRELNRRIDLKRFD